MGREDTGLVYADPNTYSGADEDDTFDEDDELVFMARHLGVRYDGNDLEGDLPEGVSTVSTMCCAVAWYRICQIKHTSPMFLFK